MKKLLLAAYIFFFTGGCFAQSICKHGIANCKSWDCAQQRQNTVVAEIDFNKPTTCFFCKADTIRAKLLITRGRMRYAHSYEGYAVIGWLATGPDNKVQWDTLYLDDRKRLLKPPVKVWGMERKEGKP